MWFTWNRTKDGLPGEVSARFALYLIEFVDNRGLDIFDKIVPD